MARIIVGFSDKRLSRPFAEALESAGLNVLRICASGNEVLRAFGLCQDGILVCGARFADRTADQLIGDLGERALALVVARPEQLAVCEHPDAFKLSLPVTRSELIATVNVLVQLHARRMPRRDEAEKPVIEQAKRYLMESLGMTEPQAHQAVQRTSMRLGLKLADCARGIAEGRIPVL